MRVPKEHRTVDGVDDRDRKIESLKNDVKRHRDFIDSLGTIYPEIVTPWGDREFHPWANVLEDIFRVMDVSSAAEEIRAQETKAKADKLIAEFRGKTSRREIRNDP